MELLSYSIRLLQSSGGDRQLGGARVLSKLAKDYRFAEETLLAIGTMQSVVERLVAMFNWRYHHQQEIRRTAAHIIFNLITIKRKNYIRVTGIAGYMESIATLLYGVEEIEIHSRQYGDQHLDPYDYSVFNMLDMQILKSLAKDHDRPR